MIRVLFVCHGNICRSPMAEFIMKGMVRELHREDEFMIASAATSTEEIGNPVYPPARKKLMEHNLNPSGKRARQLRKVDYAEYDYLIAMDHQNMRNMRRMLPTDKEGKMHLLLDFTETPGEIADPWYTGDFETTYRQIEAGCQGLLRYIDQR